MTEIEQIIKRIRDGEQFQAPDSLAVLKIAGPDARSFLQRMSTADMALCAKGNFITTCFVNHYGRLLDRVLVIALDDLEFLLVSSFASASILYDWLSHYHFIEDLSLAKHSQATLVIAHEAHARPVLWHSQQTECPFFFTVSLEPSSYPTLSMDYWESLRIATLMPGPKEITDRFMPQNIGLLRDISSNKGCFIGQEVIAKALTYQKHPKIMSGARLTHDAWRTARDQSVIQADIIDLSPCFIDGFINALVMKESTFTLS